MVTVSKKFTFRKDRYGIHLILPEFKYHWGDFNLGLGISYQSYSPEYYQMFEIDILILKIRFFKYGEGGG